MMVKISLVKAIANVLALLPLMSAGQTQGCSNGKCGLEDETSLLQVSAHTYTEKRSVLALPDFAKNDEMEDSIGSPSNVQSQGGAPPDLSTNARITKAGSKFTISGSQDGSHGTWLPYVASHTTIAWARHGAPWIGTGPYSGCEFAIFHDKNNINRVGIAHIPKPDTDESVAEWNQFKATVKVLNHFKVPLPDPTKYSASYIFVDLGADPYAISRVDVHAATMGGGNGPIFAVTKL